MTSHRKRRGFSLPELLVLLATLSVLAALLFPVFARGRQTASHSVQNRSNLKRIYLATMQYVQDNDNGFPPIGTRETNVYWWGRVLSPTRVDLTKGPLYPYLRSAQPLRSPAFRINRRPIAGGVGYGYNGRYVGGNFGLTEDTTPETVRPAKLSEIANPRLTVAFADSARWNWFTKGKAPFLEENLFLDPPNPEHYPTFHARHRAPDGTMMGHALFVDGHIAAFKPLPGARGGIKRGLAQVPPELGHLPQGYFDRE